MKFEQFIMVLLLPAGLLLIAGGAAFQHFQYWAMAETGIYATKASPNASPSLFLEPSAGSSAGSNAEYYAVLSDEPSPIHLILEPVAAQYNLQPVQTQTNSIPLIKLDEPDAQGFVEPGRLAGEQDRMPRLVAEQIKPEETQPPVFSKAEFAMKEDALRFWFPAELATEQNIKRAIARILLSSQPFNEKDILTLAPLEMRQRPLFYRRVLDQNGQPIRYPFAAFKYIDRVLADETLVHQSVQGTEITIPLVLSNIVGPAQFYEPWVMQFAADFNVSPALVFAVMETESHFNPNAVSRSNALGLMQIKAQSAGRDVYKLVDFRMDAPTPEDLFDPQTNIRIGTAYLALLKYDYFGLIRNEEVREMIAISSYNGGLSTVWRLFGDTPEAAVEQINRMNPRLVYRKLRYDHPSDETRRYLDKVLQAKQRYQALLGDDARLLASR
ncbi:murein transglycosylase domain-containing protein [Thiomicrospira sp. R3]|uniref:murein transglycosylase domain-containing protein n=1 Tax=Thiomicrospira sp. R3 TaxID=3035472 RepID=UPI00259B57F1|nr:murein transglycosylase domain-containing protein [Thiomicrospira sp. R3]WFE67924.1 murein transglycosylase domain-containing protein [Thiomicrospira sp. R3]